MDSGDAAGPGWTGGGAGEAAVSLAIFNAWSDEPWINEGAAVRVSLICFSRKDEFVSPVLDGKPVNEIYADLTAKAKAESVGNMDLTQAPRLEENQALSFQGSQKIGAFDIPGDLARSWLTLPNPHGKPNSDVLKPSWNGLDVTRRTRDVWIIDFGTDIPEEEAALYEAPFQYVRENVKPEREQNNREAYRRNWWKHGEPRVALRAALAGLPRYIVTSAHAKHLFFSWLPGTVLPDKALIVFALSDNTIFGLLHSRFHELWALRMGTSLEDRPRYTPTTTFETFPFPEGVLRPAPAVGRASARQGVLQDALHDDAKTYDPDVRFPAIAEAARRLNELRENWLNPPEWVERVPELFSPLPDLKTPSPAARGLGEGLGEEPGVRVQYCRIKDFARRSGMDRRNPDSMDDADLEHPCNLDTGDPCRYDGVIQQYWGERVPYFNSIGVRVRTYPDRIIAKPGHEADLKKRTLTNLYNERPAWLDNAHKVLDKAVAEAYGWTDYTEAIPDEEILRRLLALNLKRSSKKF